MRPPRLAAIAFAAALIVTRPASAQDTSTTASHRAAVARLMAVTRVRELTEQSAEAMIASQVKQLPQLAPYASVLRDFYREQLNWSVLEPEYTRLYLEVFSEAELRELATFYESPLGQKMLAKMPLLMTRTNELTTRRMQAAMPQLMQRLQAAMQAPAARPDSTVKRTP